MTLPSHRFLMHVRLLICHAALLFLASGAWAAEQDFAAWLPGDTVLSIHARDARRMNQRWVQSLLLSEEERQTATKSETLNLISPMAAMRQ